MMAGIPVYAAHMPAAYYYAPMVIRNRDFLMAKGKYCRYWHFINSREHERHLRLVR